MPLYETEIQQLEKVKLLIEKSYHTHYTTEYLAEMALMSRSKLIRNYRQYYGMALYEHLQHTRLELAKQLLENSSHSIKVIACSCGYKHACNFSTAFKAKYGVGPREWRRS